MYNHCFLDFLLCVSLTQGCSSAGPALRVPGFMPGVFGFGLVGTEGGFTFCLAAAGAVLDALLAGFLALLDGGAGLGCT